MRCRVTSSLGGSVSVWSRALPGMSRPAVFTQGVIPLGGCKVELVERGPKGAKFGLKITSPDFYPGRMLILATDKEDDQKGWLQTLNDCSRV